VTPVIRCSLAVGCSATMVRPWAASKILVEAGSNGVDLDALSWVFVAIPDVNLESAFVNLDKDLAGHVVAHVAFESVN
jgi:hypothetical protein